MTELHRNLHCDSRGILPRMLEDLFKWKLLQVDQHRVSCSYMEIYNENLFDLVLTVRSQLSSEKKVLSMREDFKRGIFVENLSEKVVESYEEAVGLVLEGEKTRRITATNMNNESSRSHAIFTVTIQSQIVSEEVVISRVSKMNVIDLAGSERIKHTQAEGERLKEGCSINKSLHILGNVINSLAESHKKKKYVPFRDSKLTLYLKDSLSGNSVTKLLANVHCSKKYFGDTLSTLMFAKRAKCLKLSVKVNQTTTENSESLRNEVKRLREELAKERYIKYASHERKPSAEEDPNGYLDKLTSVSEIEEMYSPRSHVEQPDNAALRMFEENELHYRALIEVYEEHQAGCRQGQPKVNSWKNMEKRNNSLVKLIQNFPVFTKIYRENLLLKRERTDCSQQANQQQGVSHASELELVRIVSLYEEVISELQLKFKESLCVLERAYSELESESQGKDKKIKELIKKRELPPELDELLNENQILKLSILELEEEVSRLEKNNSHIKIEMKESLRGTSKKIETRHEIEEEDSSTLLESLNEIRKCALREAAAAEQTISQMHNAIEELERRVDLLLAENENLRRKYNHSKSSKKIRVSASTDNNTHDNHASIKKVLFADLPPSSAKKSREATPTQVSIPKDPNSEASHPSNSKELLTLRLEASLLQKEVDQLSKDKDHLESYTQSILSEFSRPIEEIISHYRKLTKNPSLLEIPHQKKEIKELNQNSTMLLPKPRKSLGREKASFRASGIFEKKEVIRDKDSSAKKKAARTSSTQFHVQK